MSVVRHSDSASTAVATAPTLPIAVVKRMRLTEPPEPPVARPLRPSTKRPWPVVIIPTVCLLMGLAAGLWNAPALVTDFAVQFSHSYLHKNVHAADTSNSTVPVAYQQGTENIAHQYLNALLTQQYATMWSLVHPQVQAMWPNEAAFIAYWQKRYTGYTLQHFTLGSVHWLADWVNPETMREYKNVLEIPVSLALTPSAAIRAQPLAPPEDLHPERVMQNLPFIVQRVAALSKGEKDSWLVLNGGPGDLEAPILPPVQPLYTTVRVPILMYHHISDTVPLTTLGISLTVTAKMFTQQLDYLEQQGYHTITFNQLFDALYYAGPLPTRPIILTFDDGYDDAYTNAYPILKAHGFSGMFYVITGKVGWAAYLTWPQLRTMLAQGMQIGSHTIHHVDIGSLYLYSPDLAQQELQVSQAMLQKHLGILIQQFCYPSGEPFKNGSLALRQQIMTLLAADGYVGATTDPGMSGIYQSSLQPLALLRIRVDGRSDLQFFKNSLPTWA